MGFRKVVLKASGTAVIHVDRIDSGGAHGVTRSNGNDFTCHGCGAVVHGSRAGDSAAFARSHVCPN